MLGRLPRRLPPRSLARPAALDGSLLAYSMAMHIHSSFSEQSGSMDSQLYQAATNAVDVLWWTDHDARMDGISYRKTVHFTSLTAEQGATGEGGAWKWQVRKSGPLASRPPAGSSPRPCSPHDPVAGGAMQPSRAKSRATAAGDARLLRQLPPGGLTTTRTTSPASPCRST